MLKEREKKEESKNRRPRPTKIAKRKATIPLKKKIKINGGEGEMASCNGGELLYNNEEFPVLELLRIAGWEGGEKKRGSVIFWQKKEGLVLLVVI